MNANEEGLFFSSCDDHFGVFIPTEQVQRMRVLCDAAGRLETGGILTGYYTDDMYTAVVTEVTTAPEDSSASFARFYRGVKGLKQYLKEIWNRRRYYYLGEWHFHPHADPTPSETDRIQMRSIAVNADYRCPEPVLVIFGGDPKTSWKVSTHLFVRNEKEETLQESEMLSVDFNAASLAQASRVIHRDSNDSTAKHKR